VTLPTLPVPVTLPAGEAVRQDKDEGASRTVTVYQYVSVSIHLSLPQAHLVSRPGPQMSELSSWRHAHEAGVLRRFVGLLSLLGACHC
jgi:hypothetical protein